MTILGTLTDSPSIYVASLSDYNDGILHGIWIDATLGVDHIHEQVKAMLASSPYANSDFARKWGLKAEEWAIHDYSGFGDLGLSEWEQFDTVVELAELIEEHGDPALAWLKTSDWQYLKGELAETFEARYLGTFKTPGDYAYEYTESTGGIDLNSSVAKYIDYEAMARDWDYNGDISYVPGGEGVYVFSES